jgi:polysaccharide biosynthesis/export protein
MLDKIIFPLISAQTKKAEREKNHASHSPARGLWLLWFVCLVLGLGFANGCTVPAQPALTAQALVKMEAAPNPNQKLQEQLMVQASQASLANYKDYKIGPEDLLTIVVFGQNNLNRELRVNGQGEITMPLIGVVKVAGLNPTQTETKLEKLYNANYLVNPQITVTVKEYRHQGVAVTGAVAKPGTYEIIGPRTLLEVLAMAGGFINQGYPTGGGAQAGDIVEVIRHQNAADLAKELKSASVQPFSPKTETMVINLHRLVNGQDPQLNIPIKNGDVVHVPFAGTAYVLGGVRRPGNVAVKQGITVSQAVAMAGGVEPILGTNNITIMRFNKHGKPIRINTNLSEIIAQNDPDIPLKDNDVVVVNESGIKKTLFVIRQLLPIPSGSYSMTSF